MLDHPLEGDLLGFETWWIDERSLAVKKFATTTNGSFRYSENWILSFLTAGYWSHITQVSMNQLSIVRYQYRINTKSIQFQNCINAASVWYQYGINLVSIWHQFGINLVSIQYQYNINMVSIQYQYCINSVSIRYQYGVNSVSIRY